jgi:hypothetical protein
MYEESKPGGIVARNTFLRQDAEKKPKRRNPVFFFALRINRPARIQGLRTKPTAIGSWLRWRRADVEYGMNADRENQTMIHENQQ